MKAAGMSANFSNTPSPLHGWPQYPALPLPAMRRRNFWEAAIIQGAETDHKPLGNSLGCDLICSGKIFMIRSLLCRN